MKRVLIFGFALMMLTLANLAAADISGIWWNANQDAKILIQQVGDHYEGRIIWLKELTDKEGQPKRDKNNPDNSKHGQPILGLAILDHLLPSDGKYLGMMYSPEKGREFSCEISLKQSGVLFLKVNFGVMHGGVEWTRTD